MEKKKKDRNLSTTEIKKQCEQSESNYPAAVK